MERIVEVSNKPKRAEFSVLDFPTYYIYVVQSANNAVLSQALSPFGLSVMYWRVLAILQEKDNQNISYLATTLAIDRSNLSRTLDTMEKAGLIARSHASHDRRHILISITEEGRNAVDRAFPPVKKIVDQNTAGFSDEERRILISLLRRVRENVVTSAGY